MSAIGLSFVAVQSVSAETITGEITSISSEPSVVVLNDEVAINGVKIDYLCYQEGICLAVGDTVTIEYAEYYCDDAAATKYKAISVTVVTTTTIPML